ncbi:diacylglycerol kinase theta-like protein [Lates japonicus]|uniref:Diacylglycerol kinase n=1 Tax=Lates japonicus TaxID=270547 RepID=A0AAD3N6V7_LATJO|nr:diacylglycerol kinase theta-like protein [Lates japonicus]
MFAVPGGGRNQLQPAGGLHEQQARLKEQIKDSDFAAFSQLPCQMNQTRVLCGGEQEPAKSKPMTEDCPCWPKVTLVTISHFYPSQGLLTSPNGGPLAGLHTFREVPRFRVLVCGGDGTVGWVLGVLEAVRHKLVCREPPIGIVPLGTGNDLARILRWGPGYSGEDPHHILVSVDEADEVLMDRWTILLDAQDMSEDGKDNGFLEPPKIVQMNNYFGLGIDAELSLDFHLAREDEPDKFTSRFHNKGVYLKVGLQKISYTRSLHKELQLQVDTQNIPLPNIEGLIFLNIPSWGSGADLWGSEVDGRFGKPSIDDGLLEVVGVTGVVHMGQVQSGLRSGIRIAQGNYIRLTVSKPIPVQVDGEPWIQPPGHIIISAAGPKVRMLRKSKQKQKKSSGGAKDGRSESPSSRDGGH